MSILPTANGVPAKNGKILVVDDIADNRALLARRFQSRGFEIGEAEDGLEALAKVDNGDFDLVLLDVMMPGLNGLQVLARLRQRYTASELPVIMVTARHDAADVVAALDLGANDYVTKPIEFPIVHARAIVQIERRRAEVALRDTNAALLHSNDALVNANEQLRQEIARQRSFEERIDYLAHHDALTGLPNRQMFMQRLRQAVGYATSTAGQVAVLCVAVEGMRSVNEAFGHATGDGLLRTLSARVRRALPEMDVVGRLGSHEFGIIHVSPEAITSAAAVADRLIEFVNGLRETDACAAALRVSVGIAFDEGRAEPAELFHMADLAMTRANLSGSDRYRIFHPDMDAEARSRRSLEVDLRAAVKDELFELHYQPIYDLPSDRVGVVEALLRWTHPRRGVVSPLEVIPVAEATGLIIPLGAWVIASACKTAMQWPDDIKVAVNVSPVQFRDGKLLSTVSRALDESGLPAARLQIEVTESVLLGENEANLEMLNKLRSLGVQIVLDDFGTGYSSLSYLRSFRFDKIKLDKSFVRHMCGEPESRAIVQAVAGLGASFGVTLTAEGVETKEQLACLRADGYHEIQGYLLAKPQSPEALMGLLTTSLVLRAA